MKGLDKKLFPEDSEWLKGSYADLREMFGSFEYFTKYIRRRFPSVKESDIEDFRAAFLIESVEVHWRHREELDRVKIHVGYGSSTIKIFVPEESVYTTTEKKRIEDEYHERYVSRIKEGHVRMNALLWYLLSEKKKNEVRKEFPDEIDIKDLHIFRAESPYKYGRLMFKFLIIDDQEDFLHLLQQRLLEFHHATVTSARSGEDAVRLLEQGFQFDLIISDFHMPNGNGKVVFEYVQSLSSPAPFILYTSSFDLPQFEGANFLGVVSKENFRKLNELIHLGCRLGDYHGAERPALSLSV